MISVKEIKSSKLFDQPEIYNLLFIFNNMVTVMIGN